jgi:hypothetical protein
MLTLARLPKAWRLLRKSERLESGDRPLHTGSGKAVTISEYSILLDEIGLKVSESGYYAVVRRVVMPMSARAGRTTCIYCHDGRGLARDQRCLQCGRLKKRSRRNQK